MALVLAADLGFDEARAGKVAIVVTEASTNILKHAGAGEVLLQITDSVKEIGSELEVIALDKGPGIRDIDKCLTDGYSTGSSPGVGLGAIRRLSDESDFYSAPGEGMALLARWSVGHAETRTAVEQILDEPRLRVGAVNVCKRGEEFCGDSWGVEHNDCLYTVLVADGLGHGFEAGQASLEAVRILHQHGDVPPATLIDLVHRALRSMRGAAVSIARLDLMHGTLAFSGLGNVAAHIYAGGGRNQHLVSANGTAGHQAPRIREFGYAWPREGILVMHSDGLATGVGLDAHPALALCDPSLIAGVLYRDFARGHDDATVVVAKAA